MVTAGVRARPGSRDRASVAVTEMNIGNVLSAKGDYEGALIRLQKALAIQEVALGPSHVTVASDPRIRTSWPEHPGESKPPYLLIARIPQSHSDPGRPRRPPSRLRPLETRDPGWASMVT